MRNRRSSLPAKNPSDDKTEPGTLSPWARWCSGLAGLAALILGTYATFDTKNSVGSGVLIAIGALGGYLGLSGDTITSFGFGQLKVDLERQRRQNEQLQVRNENLEEVVTTVARSDTPAAAAVVEVARSVLPDSDPARRGVETAAWEVSVLEAVQRIGGSYTTDVKMGRYILDAVVDYNGKTAGIEFVSPGLQYKGWQPAVFQVEHMLMSHATASLNGFIVVIHNAPGIPPVHGPTTGVALVVWDGPSDDDNLRRAIDLLPSPA